MAVQTEVLNEKSQERKGMNASIMVSQQSKIKYNARLYILLYTTKIKEVKFWPCLSRNHTCQCGWNHDLKFQDQYEILTHGMLVHQAVEVQLIMVCRHAKWYGPDQKKFSARGEVISPSKKRICYLSYPVQQPNLLLDQIL